MVHSFSLNRVLQEVRIIPPPDIQQALEAFQRLLDADLNAWRLEHAPGEWKSLKESRYRYPVYLRELLSAVLMAGDEEQVEVRFSPIIRDYDVDGDPDNEIAWVGGTEKLLACIMGRDWCDLVTGHVGGHKKVRGLSRGLDSYVWVPENDSAHLSSHVSWYEGGRTTHGTLGIWCADLNTTSGVGLKLGFVSELFGKGTPLPGEDRKPVHGYAHTLVTSDSFTGQWEVVHLDNRRDPSITVAMLTEDVDTATLADILAQLRAACTRLDGHDDEWSKLAAMTEEHNAKLAAIAE